MMSLEYLFPASPPSASSPLISLYSPLLLLPLCHNLPPPRRFAGTSCQGHGDKLARTETNIFVPLTCIFVGLSHRDLKAFGCGPYCPE